MRTNALKSIWLRLLIVGAVAAVAVPQASASGGGPKKKTENVEKGPSIPSVQMPMLVAPVMVRGELARYVYLSVMLILPDETNKMMLLEKIPYIQDAFLREVHGATIALGEDAEVLDEEGVGRRLLNICAKILGPDIVKKVEFRDSAKEFK